VNPVQRSGTNEMQPHASSTPALNCPIVPVLSLPGEDLPAPRSGLATAASCGSVRWRAGESQATLAGALKLEDLLSDEYLCRPLRARLVPRQVEQKAKGSIDGGRVREGLCHIGVEQDNVGPCAVGRVVFAPDPV
jgi:hypothetical protein